MIRQTDLITGELVEECKKEVHAKKKIAAAADVQLEVFEEGKCVQILHVGPYATEESTIEKMLAFMVEFLSYDSNHHYAGEYIRLGEPGVRLYGC
mgnify:CR=1 FL=1